MNKFCCFFCPISDYTDKKLSDKCPTCQRAYGFVLDAKPITIGQYNISRALGRGFYGAAYVAERSTIGRKFVLKISPQSFYAFFGKPAFEVETRQHAQLSEKADHVVKIHDAFPQIIEFSDDAHTTLPCYVTILDFVDGELLIRYLDGEVPVSAEAVCQIAIDLLRIQAEFASHTLNHNDLHAENLIVERLRPEFRRQNAICDSIRVTAIDLGSMSDDSKSNEQRLGDLMFIANHVQALLSVLLKDTVTLEDREFRIALALQAIVNGLQTDVQNMRLPNCEDLITQIRDAYYHASYPWRPWDHPFQLKGLGDHYNAQTLDSWNVPKLLVDPESRWLREISVSGPQIITGMRGCGKTMLLRALDIHARAARQGSETNDAILMRIRNDGFVGLFVSAQRLLDLRPQSLYKLEYRLSRLFVNYALQAVRALLHLKSVSPQSVAVGAHIRLATAVADYLEGASELRLSLSIEDLEQRLTRVLVMVVRDSDRYSVGASPAEVFTHLAKELCSCSHVFQSSTVFFLLDDVSTRYLELDKVSELLSALLFQSPCCAFKFTSEWQTIELGLKSPGREHPIREGRDLTVFDLGADVFRTVNSLGGGGKKFVSDILLQRASVHPAHPRKHSPLELLGDVSLEQVALEIATTKSTSDRKKQIYRGISCLANVCVGDLGDVIKLYEEIVRRAPANGTLPISSSIQSECFRDLATRRLYDLNRRKGYFKDHALAFAEAAHELLVRSYKIGKRRGIDTPRLRQYSSIYVRVTADQESKIKEQIDVLRQLIDASVFVFSGGSPRTKTKDSNPIQQFILSYRKIYGLTSFIGLGDRDRFELSGADLEEWIERPSAAKEILLRNQINSEIESSSAESEADSEMSYLPAQASQLPANKEDLPAQSGRKSGAIPMRQLELFQQATSENPSSDDKARACPIEFNVQQLSNAELKGVAVGGVVIGLGFEERTLASNRHLANLIKPPIVHAIRYSLAGHSDAILCCWAKTSERIREVRYIDGGSDVPTIEGLALLDVSGLTKPLIFSLVRRELMSKGRVLICHASARDHYPLEEDLSRLMLAEEEEQTAVLLEQLAKILTGEVGPYRTISLLEEQSDPSRSRALLAFASPKHQRLFSLLDRREFDFIEIITPVKNSPRFRVAGLAADFVRQNFSNTKVGRIDTDDLVGLVRYLDDKYLDVYVDAGSNLEIGLTGSKMQAVASAILSARRKIAQAWYVSPSDFDEKRFSSGVGSIKVYDVRLQAP
jgi:hypothetical protein